MVLRAVSFCLLVALTSCGHHTERDSSLPALPIDAKKLYQLHCVDCHGADGTLGLSGAKDLSTSTLGLDDRIAVIKNGSSNGKMRPFGVENYGDLSNEEVEEVAHYIETLRK